MLTASLLRVMLFGVLAAAVIAAFLSLPRDAARGQSPLNAQGYPPPAHAPGQMPAAAVDVPVNLSPSTADGDQLWAWVDTGDGGRVILWVGADFAAAKVLAQDWVAKNHPGAKVMYLPPQGHGPPMEPPKP